MIKRTPFYDHHLKANAKIVDFAGFEMPLHYGSQIKEHFEVRQHAGLFDVSHMGIVDIEGSEAKSYLRYLLANDVDRLTNGKALYTCMLNEQGGVLDDLIVYKISDNYFRLIINAGTRHKDLAWMKKQSLHFQILLLEREDLVMLALQGPEVKDKLKGFLPEEEWIKTSSLRPFTFLVFPHYFIARTGYTGEDGFEIIFSRDHASAYWQALVSRGFIPCGLGARDTLRLEVGLNLYGNDMNESVTPLESGLAWTVSFDATERDFIGKAALLKIKESGLKKKMVGLVLRGPGIMRQHQKVLVNGKMIGEVTSGGYSPSLEKSIGLAHVDINNESECFVEIRNKLISAIIVKPPFVKYGKKLIEIN